MEACHAAGTPYQQRIWKVSNALDRLAVMCEQHHFQTKHVDGLPDWTVPKSPAGVPPPARVEPPANFAWHDAKPVTPLDMTKKDLEENEKANSKMDKEELSTSAMDPDERVTQQLRASTTQLLSRLSPPSLSSSVSSTTAPVFPQQKPQPRDDDITMKTANDAVGRRTRTHSSTESSRSMSSRPQSSSTSTGSVREAGEPHRRRKVHFADHGRSYRGDRPMRRMVDLTYHEALRAIPPKPSTAGSQAAAEPRTTYQQTYQWPRREAFVEMMDRVGGQAAGGETRYEPRRVFTAEAAIFVAKESARDLLKKPVKVPSVDVEDRHDDTTPTPYVMEKHQKDSVEKSTVREVTPSVNQTVSEPVKEEEATIVAAKPSQRRTGALKGTTVSHNTEMIRPKTATSATRSTCVEVATQTERPPTVKKPSVRQEQISTHHTGYCSHCGRSGDVAETKTKAKVRTQAVPRPTRVNPQRDNPIFLNARYPSEPSVFRAKSTYMTEFGKKQVRLR